MTLVFISGFTACGTNNSLKPAEPFPFEELNEIYDSVNDSDGEKFDKKNEGRRYIVNSSVIKRISFKSSVEYDIFCYVESGERTFNYSFLLILPLAM